MEMLIRFLLLSMEKGFLMTNSQETYKCVICGEVKLLSQFYKSKTNANGHAHECIKCTLARGRRYRKKIKSQIKDETMLNIRRSVVAEKLCLYRKRFRVLHKAGITINLLNPTEKEQIANNELIDKTLEAAGLGDKREPRTF